MSRRTVRTTLRATTRERRDPQAATVQLQYSGLGQPQTNRHNAARVTARALTAWVVMRCIQIKAQDLAGIPFVAGARIPVAHTELPETNPTARLARLVGQTPAPKLSAQVWWEWMLTQRYITGQFAAEIDWAGTPTNGDVAALWPLTASALKAVPTDGGPQWWKRFEYGRADKPKTLTPDRVFYGWDPAPDDFRQPWSILASAQIDVDVAVQVGRYNAAFLRNDARPAAVVVTEAFNTDDDFDQFVNQFEGRHQGVDNAGKLAFVETSPDGALPGQAIRIETLGISQKDARMLEMHRASLEHVAMALGVPWSRLSAADRTFSNAGQESTDYWVSLAADARKFGAEVNASLAPLLGPEVGWFDLSGVEALAARPPVSASEAAILVNGLIASPEEVRPWFGLTAELPEGLALPVPPVTPALPAGGTSDGVGVSAGTAAASRSAGDAGDTGSGGAGGSTGTPGLSDGVDRRELAPGDAGGVRGAAAPGLPAAGGVGDDRTRANGGASDRRVLTAEEQETRRTTIWRRNDAALRGLQTRFTKAWAAYFNRQAAAVIAQITGKRCAARLTAASQARELRADLGIGGPMDPNEIARWRAQALDLADLMHTAATTSGVTRVNNAFGVSFDLEAPFIRDFITARANQLAGQVTDTTYSAIQQALADGVSQGLSIDDLAVRVQDVFDVASSNRAKTIARTEVISASNGSASLAAAQLPADVAAGQEFIATRDERTRDDHAEADGQIVAMGQPFIVGGESLLYPGDPAGSAENVINCRCTVAFLTPQDLEKAGRSRRVGLSLAKFAVRSLTPGAAFDAAEFRRSLAEVA